MLLLTHGRGPYTPFLAGIAPRHRVGQLVFLPVRRHRAQHVLAVGKRHTVKT